MKAKSFILPLLTVLFLSHATARASDLMGKIGALDSSYLLISIMDYQQKNSVATITIEAFRRKLWPVIGPGKLKSVAKTSVKNLEIERSGIRLFGGNYNVLLGRVLTLDNLILAAQKPTPTNLSQACEIDCREQYMDPHDS